MSRTIFSIGITLLLSLSITPSSFAKYAEGTCLKEAKIELSLTYCYEDASIPHIGYACGSWKMTDTLEWKYSQNPAKELVQPEIRTWQSASVDEAQFSGNKKIVPASSKRIQAHIPQYQTETGEWYLSFENIGWNIQQKYEVFPNQLSIGIEALKSKLQLGSLFNQALVKAMFKADPENPVWFADISLSEPVYAECKNLNYEQR